MFNFSIFSEILPINLSL